MSAVLPRELPSNRQPWRRNDDWPAESLRPPTTKRRGTSFRFVPIQRGEPRNGHPPGQSMPAYPVQKDQLGCAAAAEARGVPSDHELKSLVLRTKAGLVAVHVLGTLGLNLRELKRQLGCKKASLAAPEELAELGLASGRVSAVLDPVWSMSNLLAPQVLRQPFVTTNNGTREAFVLFDPQILLTAPRVRLLSADACRPLSKNQPEPAVRLGNLVGIRDWRK